MAEILIMIENQVDLNNSIEYHQIIEILEKTFNDQ